MKKDSFILITGASGFVGINFTRVLKEQGYNNWLALSRNHLNLLNQHDVDNFWKESKPDVCVHLAAFCGGIGLNMAHPADMIHDNLVMGCNVVKACSDHNTKLVFLGSVCSYPLVPPRIPFVEKDLWKSRPEPTNEPYGVAKKTIGLMIDAFHRQYGLKAAYLIPTNMYGPHDDFDFDSSHVIPAMIRKFVDAGDEVCLWGDGTPTREFLYVDDCSRAIIAAIESDLDPQPMNIGGSGEISMKDLAGLIANIIGYNGNIRWDTSKPNGQPRRAVCADLIKERLGFESKTSLREGINKTIEWYETSGEAERWRRKK